ncbi:MAG: type II secretion system major pseudopilin GspG [Candidatus Brocadiia bacterium]
MKNEKGFTLIELLLVAVIIAILASVVVGNFVGQEKKVYDARVKADFATISTALDLYSLDNGMFPSTEQGLKALIEKPSSTPVPSNWTKRYLVNDPDDPWKKEYKYRYPGEHNKDRFDIWSTGPDGKDGTEDDVGNWKTTQ